jgi:hypothetical protein
MLVRYAGSEPHPHLVVDRDYVVLALDTGGKREPTVMVHSSDPQKVASCLEPDEIEELRRLLSVS